MFTTFPMVTSPGNVSEKAIYSVSPPITKLMSHVLATGIRPENTISQSLGRDTAVPSGKEMHTPKTHLSYAWCERRCG